MCVHASVGLTIELDCLLVLAIPPLVPSLFLFYQIFKTEKRGVKKQLSFFWGVLCFVIIRYFQNFQQMHIDIKPVFFSSFLSFIMIQINSNPAKTMLSAKIFFAFTFVFVLFCLLFLYIFSFSFIVLMVTSCSLSCILLFSIEFKHGAAS